MVAGGEDSTSVLTLLPDATAWTTLSSLPTALGSAGASIVGGRIRVTGGNSVDLEYVSREVMGFHSKLS